MTHEPKEAAFQRGLAELLERFDRTLADDASEPYAGAGVGRPLEHTTRIHLLDALAELLGWSLGLGGNVAEEARIKNGTTAFMDYLGVAPETRAPVLLIEAKAWDKPFITPRANASNLCYEAAELIAQAIEHWRKGGGRSSSPAMTDWHDYVEQVGKYVQSFWEVHGHPLPRAVVTSGQWLVAFTQPLTTFVQGPARAKDIRIFKKPDYCAQSSEIFDLLSRDSLCTETPDHIRASQVQSYIKPEALVACFHAVHLSYEASGSRIIGQRPRILIYPALVLQRNDKALVTVIGNSSPLELAYRRDIGDLRLALKPHLEEVATAAKALLQDTGDLLQCELHPSSVETFPGYEIDAGSDRVKTKSLIKRYRMEPDAWLLITGQRTHFMELAPNVACKYHRWSACHANGEAIGTAAVSMPQIAKPRSFFVDDQPHHCAHQGLQDRRKARCQLLLIDERFCCASCLFALVCWPGNQQPPLPCGK